MNWITNGVDEDRVIATLQNELESLRTQMAQEVELGNVSVATCAQNQPFFL